MRSQISALFHLQDGKESPVDDTLIGSGIFIRRIERGWLNEVRVQCPRIAARELVEWMSPYTHRLFYEKETEDAVRSSDRSITSEEKQPIIKAIVLSRIVKPTTIAYDNVWLKSVHLGDNGIEHHDDTTQVINNLNMAFISPGVEDWNTITDVDASVMAELWDSFQFFHEDANEPKYRRIVRAFKFHEQAYAIYFAEIFHPVFHAALESMICTGHKQNKAQVTQRLPQLVSFVNAKQAEDIYLTCCDFKHAAQALLQVSPSINGILAPSDQKRLDAVILLRRAIRELLIRAIRDRSFADKLADPKLLRTAYPVYDNSGKLV